MEETNNNQIITNQPKKFDSHKVWAMIGLILIGFILIVSLLAYLYRDRLFDILSSTSDDATVSVTKVSTSSAKTATNSATTSATQ